MRTLLILASVIPLAACNTVQQQQLLTDLQGCTRHYEGVVTAGVLNTGTGFNGSVKIDCAPKPSP